MVADKGSAGAAPGQERAEGGAVQTSEWDTPEYQRWNHFLTLANAFRQAREGQEYDPWNFSPVSSDDLWFAQSIVSMIHGPDVVEYCLKKWQSYVMVAPDSPRQPNDGQDQYAGLSLPTTTEIFDRLDDAGCDRLPDGRYPCPACGYPATVTERNGVPMITCGRRCSWPDVLAALGFERLADALRMQTAVRAEVRRLRAHVLAERLLTEAREPLPRCCAS